MATRFVDVATRFEIPGSHVTRKIWHATRIKFQTSRPAPYNYIHFTEQRVANNAHVEHINTQTTYPINDTANQE